MRMAGVTKAETDGRSVRQMVVVRKREKQKAERQDDEINSDLMYLYPEEGERMRQARETRGRSTETRPRARP
jgi:hypothetical protein